MKNDQVTAMIDALRPAVDELADAAYERRPDPSVLQPREVRAPSRRRPVRGIALGLGAATAAAAVAVAATLPSGAGGHHQAAPDTTIDARAFLLASADTAAKQPTTHGTCWYTRTRMSQDLGGPLPAKAKPKATPLPFRARTAAGHEDWICGLPGVTGLRLRSHGPLDARATFPTKRDESAWRAAGSPPLDVNGGTTATKPFTVTYDKPSHIADPVIGSHEIAWRSVPSLPSTKPALGSYLRELWQQDRKGGAHGYTAPADYCQYVFVAAWDLFMAPTSPGTRSSLFRILADCPSLRATGGVADSQGRRGVALASGGVRLVVSPATAQLLEFDEAGADRLTFEKQGWVGAAGALPTR
ncbi:hypothetical protein [Actinomadura harenae]|uniref:Uncharacterized protein n=1 Tax=Actinomadura harenae TaxID=2483351 RepID=A0A3M2MGM9_9ACTN|nr:hypothetical protein [Actinomadura harenae]RMI47825.1 hypothetical protein EBO15_00565 [Actinomadura harenae]